MQVHYGKTTCMLVGTRQRINMSHKLNIQIENTCIQNVSKQKLLGIYIDENLTWSSHIDHLCSVIASKISLLRQLSEYVSAEIQKIFLPRVHSSFYWLRFCDVGIRSRHAYWTPDVITKTCRSDNIARWIQYPIWSYVQRARLALSIKQD